MCDDKKLATKCYYYDKPGTYDDDNNRSSCSKDLSGGIMNDCFVVNGSGHITGKSPVGKCVDFKEH